MAEDSKKVLVEIDADTYSLINEYSEYTNQDPDSVINFLVKRTFADFNEDYENLKTGYVEMGTINLEISDAFTVSENEALNHIQKD